MCVFCLVLFFCSACFSIHNSSPVLFATNIMFRILIPFAVCGSVCAFSISHYYYYVYNVMVILFAHIFWCSHSATNFGSKAKKAATMERWSEKNRSIWTIKIITSAATTITTNIERSKHLFVSSKSPFSYFKSSLRTHPNKMKREEKKTNEETETERKMNAILIELIVGRVTDQSHKAHTRKIIIVCELVV